IATGQAASDELEGLLHGYAEPDRHTPITLDCLMTQTGHLGAASGLAALIKSSLELHTLATPAVYGLSHPAAVIESNPLFSVSTEPSALKPTNEDGRLLTAVNNADRQIAYHILLERESKVRAPNDHAKSSSSTSSYDQHTVDGVPLIDATRRRRDAMRDRATQATAQLQGQSAHDASSVDETHEISTAKTDSAPSLVSKTTSMTKAVIEPVARELSATQLEAFLIGFIVEQTGYPAEFVEMGADLEADLGIDSIKKAQMFGELGEQFSITPDENLTLDDFPTLQHVLDYLAPFVGPTKPQTSRIAGEAEKVGAAPPRLASPLPEPLVAAKKAGKERAVTDSSRKQNGQVERQIEQEFLEFFSEQTGYPVDFVEMDAKLDGDLAIDAPRKKQLLEELSRAFAIPKPERTNDQSLATVGDLLEWVRSEAAALPARSSSPSPREDNEDPKTVSQSNDRQNALIPEFKRLTRTMDLLAMAGLSSPYFAEHETVTRDTTQIDGKEVITFCSSNYLGMSGDPRVNAAAQDAIERLGTSVSASRLIAGKPLHRQLEDELARFLGAEATIVFSSGYAANESTIGHLFGPGDLIIHDSLAHNCIIQGAILSGAHRLNFPHNDFDALDQQLERVRGKYRRTLIAIEGVYSMDGDHCDLPTAIEIKHRHDAFLLVDDAHAIGTMGATGRGSPEFFNVDPAEIDLWVGTLSKALGSGGGFVAGSRDLISYLKHSAPGFIYTVALSPACAGAALASLELVRQEPQRITKLQNNAALLLDLAKQRGLDVGPAARTPIVPVMVGNSHTALLLSRRLLDRGIDIQPIVHPAVENDAARLRFMVTAKHTEDQIRTTIDALADDLKAVQSESVPIDEWKAVLSGKKSLPDTTANGQPANSADEESAAKKSADIADQPSGSMKTVPSVAPNNTPSPAKSPTSSPADLSRVELRVVSGELIDPSQECHWTKKDLREYLINFIVEQTGYPPEFVEMDADLEADLGIDSIKKAQLFGELGQHFEITPDETLTLDDFPSLQEVFDYIGEQTGIDS
ncbi:MAG: aminotransferase class I/II-fold pyridoxal phosphate-dependent enzyme, partial [Planctomycetota bacterium]